MEELLELDPSLLRAIIREKTHHTVEFPLYQAVFSDTQIPTISGKSLRNLLDIWKQRGYSTDNDDLRWSYMLLELSDQIAGGERVYIQNDPGSDFSEVDQAVIQRLIKTRRSIRIWEDSPVPKELIQKVIRAGLWAPHSCNLQTLRFVVVEDEDGRSLFQSGEITDWKVCIVVGQDLRPYECFAASVPTYNQFFDCGAAVQNMLLAAHSLGLGAVWGTFAGKEAESIHNHFQLPEYVKLRTYVAMGWPAQDSLPPGRISLKDAVLAWG